ncbi:GntR family transcriptional regulator [Streptomyces sp. 1114.5]|uniref:GntR family transcriptional regulator n=1 Tax=Streptomyces sp. 1114.5 TaxID=1938830 RepID=UPI000EAB9132|nr:GntR family transcriptional regulator [Streptomyces sp. 1114.5]RKT17989.1 GntR family transcriptional regulator [Streptomyces sp. 1114.5]
MAIIRNEALHKQVAAAMRQAIAGGEWPPGTQLPTETDLAQKYGVSRPTVRLAVAALRSEGQLDVKQGRGTFVRTTVHGPASAMERTVSLRSGVFETPTDAWFGTGEEPSVYRTRTDAITAPLLEMQQDELMLGCDRLLTEPSGDSRALHRLMLPMERIEGTPLAQQPGVTPAEAYTTLTTAGHELAWRERVSARVPQPDEREALRLSEAAVLLVAHRITYDQATGLPLLLEELRLGAETTGLTYDIEATKPRRAARTAKTAR